MAVTICNTGKIHLLNLMLKTALGVDEPFSLHLFQNNINPSGTTVVGDLTEASFTNYTSVTLNRTTWSTPAIVSNVARTAYSTASWTCGVDGNTIYGAYILDGSGNLVWVDKFSTPEVLEEEDIMNYTPVFTFASA
jgi:hypothetical protein